MNNLQTIQQIVESWIHVSSDRHPISLGDEKSSATARGSFLGEDTSDPAAKGRKIYTEFQNLPTAVASILNHAQNRANFHPASTPAEQLYGEFRNYVEEVDKTPFLHLLEQSKNRQQFYSKDYNLLIDQVVNLFDGVTAQDKDAIKRSIADMAKSVFGQKKSEKWNNLFSQSTLDLSDLDNPKIYVYYTTLHMFHEQKGKAEISQQDYEVSKTTYLILPDLIKASANKLVALDQKSVDDWLGSATSPERKNAKLCFEPTEIAKAA